MRRGVVVGTAVGAAFALCACDDVFGLTRHVDAAIDTPTDSKLGGPDAPTDAAIDAPADAAIDAPPGPVCPASYATADVALLNKYRLVTTITTWTAAEAGCAADQIPGATRYTHLAVIDDDQERSRLSAVSFAQVWIGASDRVTESVYRWVTIGGAMLPATGTPWSSGQPAHISPGDDCVEMNNTADYIETDCLNKFAYWCECDDKPVIPANF